MWRTTARVPQVSANSEGRAVQADHQGHGLRRWRGVHPADRWTVHTLCCHRGTLWVDRFLKMWLCAVVVLCACMCVCACVCVCMHVCVRVRVCVCVVRVCVHACARACVRACLCERERGREKDYASVWMRVCVCVFVHGFVHVWYIYIHVCASSLMVLYVHRDHKAY